MVRELAVGMGLVLLAAAMVVLPTGEDRPGTARAIAADLSAVVVLEPVGSPSPSCANPPSKGTANQWDPCL
jgi:hypothetical protein